VPTRAPTGCTEPRCPNPSVNHGRCAQHPAPGRWDSGAHGRPMPPGWSRTRARIMARDGYTCPCGAPAVEVHHMYPGVEEDWALRSMCAPCHLEITARQAAAARARAGRS
jgi:hypothetical protein